MSRNRARSRARALSIFSDSAIDLNFIPIAGTSPALDPRITFTRSTTGTYVNNAGVITSAAINAPRFDYDPATLALKGLLIEEQRTNMVLQSQDFATTWATSASLTIATNTTTAPDGTTTADTVSATSTVSYCFQDIIFSADGTKAYSIFLKAGTSGRSRIFIRDQTAGISRGDAVITWTGGIPSVVMSLGSLQGIQAYANGWYRLQVIVDSVVAANSNQFRIFPDNIAGTGSMIVWGAQIENAAFSTSYIPTTTAAVTRAADLASMTGTNFSSWYNQTEGTIYVQAQCLAAITAQTYLAIDDGTANNLITIRTSPSSATFERAQVVDGGVTQAALGGGGYVATLINDFAFAYKTNDFARSFNGSSVATDTSGTVPTVNQMFIGSERGQYFVNGHIRRIVYYPTRLSNEELRALTSYSRNIPLWTPAQISTALWLDAADASTITLNGSTVSQWADKSGNGRNVVQATASAQPTYNATGLNSKPTLTADTTRNLSVATTGFSGGDSLWVIAVASMNAAAQTYARLVSITSPTADDFNNDTTTAAILRVFTGNSIGAFRGTLMSNGGVSLSTPTIIDSIYNGTNHTAYINGVAQTPVAATGNFTNVPRITLFGYLVNPANSQWSGSCSEVIIGDSTLSTDNRQKLEGYLAWKWGLQANLQAGHPYKNVPPLL